MKLIIGLGNPGKKYQNTRHNLGFIVLDQLASEFGITNYELSKKGQTQYAWVKIGREKIEILKPQTFMNNSGFAVRYAKDHHRNLKNSDICVIHDDLDLKFGEYKIQFGRGPRRHNGVLSIEASLSSKDFWRLRVGIDSRLEAKARGLEVGGKDYVLGDFLPQELKKIKDLSRQITAIIFDRLKLKN